MNFQMHCAIIDIDIIFKHSIDGNEIIKAHRFVFYLLRNQSKKNKLYQMTKVHFVNQMQFLFMFKIELENIFLERVLIFD